MTQSFVQPGPGAQTLKDQSPSSPDEIRYLTKLAGLPAALADELCQSYPAFEAMVRRLPRDRERCDEPAHHVVASGRIAALDEGEA